MSARPGWLRPSVSVALLALAALASATLLLVLTGRLTFFLDDWDLLLHRRGFSAEAFLRPHNEHIIIAPAAVYKAIQATIGMDSARPYQAVAIAVFVTSAVLLFVWLRRRVGEWPALFGAVVILFLGSAWEDLLSPFQIGFFGSMSCGLAMLLALERESRRADALACLLLVASVSFSSLGLAFIAGAAVAIATGSKPQARWWVPAIPAVLFAAWWVGWGHTADTQVSFESVAEAPRYVLDGISASLASLLGLGPPESSPPGGPLPWGRVLLVVAIGAALWRIHRIGRVGRWLWVVLATTATFWLLAGANSALFRSPTSPRYMYMGAIFCLLIAAELSRGTRASRGLLATLAVVGLAAVASNLTNLREGYQIFKATTDRERGGLTALELARDRVAPDFLLTDENSDAPYFDYVDAESYLSAVDAFGSPGYSEQELLGAPEPTRVAADKALVAALRIELERSQAGVSAAGAPPENLFAETRELRSRPSCLRVAPAEGGIAVLTAPANGVVLEGQAQGAKVEIRRYATESFPVELGKLPAARRSTILIPADRGTQPWQLQLSEFERLTACGVA